MSDHPPRLLPYCRQSLARIGETRETSLSLQAQHEVISDWAHANGFVVAPPIKDHDLKGDDPNRPGLLELEQSAQPGDTVAVYKWDRLARDVPLQETLVRRLQARDIQVISVTEPSTRLTRVIYGAVNEEFRDALSQRIKDARKQQALRGHYTGAGTPYGYERGTVRAIPLPDGGTYLRPSGQLVPVDGEASTVREAFRRVAAGEAVFAIVVDFNQRGIPTRRGSYWQVSTLRRVIQNHWYTGVATYKGEPIAPGLHEPLIDQDMWERANRLIARPKRRQKKHDDVSSWLEGLVYHACGRRMYLMTLQHHRNRQHYTEHFACQTAYQTIKCEYERRHISARKLDTAVRECLISDLSGIAPVADAFARATVIAGGPETAERRRQLEERRAKTLQRYERVRDAWAAGLESLDWLAAEQEKRDTALTEIDTALATLPATPDPGEYERIGASLGSMAARIADADDGRLAGLLTELGRVEVWAEGVSIRYDGAITHFIPVPCVAVVG